MTSSTDFQINLTQFGNHPRLSNIHNYNSVSREKHDEATTKLNKLVKNLFKEEDLENKFFEWLKAMPLKTAKFIVKIITKLSREGDKKVKELEKIDFQKRLLRAIDQGSLSLIPGSLKYQKDKFTIARFQLDCGAGAQRFQTELQCGIAVEGDPPEPKLVTRIFKEDDSAASRAGIESLEWRSLSKSFYQQLDQRKNKFWQLMKVEIDATQ